MARTRRSNVITAGVARSEISLCEVLDRVLNKGVVITGEITVSLAGVDLLYVGLNLIVSSVETMRQQMVLPN